MHVDDTWQMFSERVAYQGQLHVAVESLDPHEEVLAGLNERNLHVLRALASLDERRPENGDDDSPLLQELQRMDSKLNVLLDIVDRMLVPEGALPPRQRIRFNAVGATLPASLLSPGEHCLVRLHFDLCRAMPLELAAHRSREVDASDVFVCFVGMNEMVQDGLERFVFCHHRRKVAEARLTAAGDGVNAIKSRV